VKEHTALIGAARDLRKRLAATNTTSLMFVPPGLKAALPVVGTLLEALEDLADEVVLLRAMLDARQVEKIPPQIEARAG